MNNIKRLSLLHDSFISDFLENSFNQFEKDIPFELDFIDEGIIPASVMTYVVWMFDPMILKDISKVTNHEGAWEVVVKSGVEIKRYNQIAEYFARAINFTSIDSIYELTLKYE